MSKKTRKYESYKVEIVDEIGGIDTITFNGVNTSDYKSMLQVYRDTKEKYNSDNCTIHFVGVSREGQLNILHTKIIKPKSKNKEIKDMLVDVIDNLNNIKKREVELKPLIKNANKTADLSDHLFDTFDKEEFATESEKKARQLQIFNIHKENRNTRRELKVEGLLGNYIHTGLGNNNMTLDSLITILEGALSGHISQQESIKPISKAILEEHKVMVKIEYKSATERIKFMKRNKHKYAKITNHGDNNTGYLECIKKCS